MVQSRVGEVRRLALPVALACCGLLVAGCDPCDGHSDYLTLSIGQESGYTTPRWGGTWQHPGGAFAAEAQWGTSDNPPTEKAFELYDITGADRLPVVMAVTDCRVGDGSQGEGNACDRYFQGGGCPYAARRWRLEQVQEGRTYLLVHRLSQGNGKKLNQTGPVETIDGESAYTMKIVLAAEQ